MNAPSQGPEPLSTSGKLEAFDSVPLFMQSLPAESSDDVAISALQSLAHEGTPDEVAQNFKDQGNDYFKGKRYTEARGFYSQALDAKPTDLFLQEALLCNRAACNLELQNYGMVLRDCSAAIKLNGRSSKAFYRSSLALVALERYEEAIDCCSRCLEFDSSNGGIKSVQDRAAKAKSQKDKKDKEKEVRLKQEFEQRKQMNIAFKARNILPVVNPNPSENPYEPHFEIEHDPMSPLVLPVLFLYPQHATSDFVSGFVETSSFRDHLDTMFPPETSPSWQGWAEWDSKQEYSAPNLVVYAITRGQRLFKVGKRMTLRDVCDAAKGKDDVSDGLELKDGCLSAVVLPKGDAERRWVDEFKAARQQ